MSIPPEKQKSFAERAQELREREQAEAQKQQAIQLEQKRLADLHTKEGPSKAQQMTEEAFRLVQEQISGAGAPFSISDYPQRGAQLEVLIRKSFLITGNLHGMSLSIGIYDLSNSSESLESGVFKFSIGKDGDFYWRFESGGASTRMSGYVASLNRTHILNSAKDIADLVLDRAMNLAEKTTNRR